MFDLSKAKTVTQREDAGTVVHVRDEAGNPLFFGDEKNRNPITITVAGEYSRVARSHAEKARRQSSRELNRGVTKDDSDFLEDLIDRVAACTLSWQGIADGDKPLECNPANAKRLYTEAPWVYNDVWAAHRDHARFFGDGSRS